MVVAELELFHSRPIAPTRRVALGDAHLPLEPRPGAGGILLAGIVASCVDVLDADGRDELDRLADQLEIGVRISQPRLRHRLQEDRVGLTRSQHRLVEADGALRFDLELGKGAPEQHLLGALYAAGGLRAQDRPPVFAALRTAMAWRGGVGPVLIARLGGSSGAGASIGNVLDPIRWALGILHLPQLDGAAGRTPPRVEVQRRYRELLRAAHPDHGGAGEEAAVRIEQLREARRILLR